MKAYYHFLKANFSGVSFGWLLTLFSSFGQTFLISLYIPEFVSTFQLSEGTFGNIYAGATVTASLVMLSVGHTLDYYPVKRVMTLTILGLVASLLLMSSSPSWVYIVVALIGLRLAGQGMMGHISQTVMARYYSNNRGKALSIASLGFSIGEALFPFAISVLITQVGWRYTALASAGLLVVFLLTQLFRNLRPFDPADSAAQSGKDQALWRAYLNILREKRFYALLPGIFVMPFTVTGIFFFQYVIAEEKGWSVTLYSAFFTGFAIARFIFSLYGGLWVDRFSAPVVFRFFLVPLLLSFIPITVTDHIGGALLFLVLSGVSMGLSGPVKSALFAEMYGTKRLGTVRSLFTMIMVISTALGPLLVGNLMDWGVPIDLILAGMMVLVLSAVLNCQRIQKATAAVQPA